MVSLENGITCGRSKTRTDRHFRFISRYQNPRSPTDDVSRNSFAIEQIRKSFKHAYYVLTSNFWQSSGVSGYLGSKRNHRTILSWIIKLPREVVYYRRVFPRRAALARGRHLLHACSAEAACLPATTP